MERGWIIRTPIPAPVTGICTPGAPSLSTALGRWLELWAQKTARKTIPEASRLARAPQEGDARRRQTSSIPTLKRTKYSHDDLHGAHPLWGEAARIIALAGKLLRVTALAGPTELGSPLKRGKGQPISLKVT